MIRMKIDNRIRVLIENGVKLGHRTLFAIVGGRLRDQVVNVYHMLATAEVKGPSSILWCYKGKVEYSRYIMKDMKQKTYARIRYCSYSETDKISGNTFGMCVLQDFAALTPNLLARTIETVEGGGVIVILLPPIKSVKQCYAMSMDVHERFRTEAHQDVVCRFNERFLLSLALCERCLIVDDQLSVLPISSHNLHVTPEEANQVPSTNEAELEDLKRQLRDTQPCHLAGTLVNCCKTLDQAKAVLKFIDAMVQQPPRSTVSLTGARGRGKSAAMGLSVAAAVASGYTNIFVTSPSPENLNTFFEFVCKGFGALKYQENIDYSLVQSTNRKFNKAIVRVEIFRMYKQTIEYIQPTDCHKLKSSLTELLVIDEAAAIPLPYVKAMLGPYLVLLASTIDGYEGTGRSLSLTLLQELRGQAVPVGTNTNGVNIEDSREATGRTLHEVTLDESIRYKPGDNVETWLTKLLCLDVTSVAPISSGCPPPENCDLYHINRDIMFSNHNRDTSEEFLQRLIALYVASHYQCTPDDLQMMSDAPAHHIFCLLGPVDAKKTFPEVLVTIHVCVGSRPGDLIPWTVSQEYQDPKFLYLSCARVVKIATHADYQGMGYGTKALNILKQYYACKIPSMDEYESAVEEIGNVAEEVSSLEKTIEPRKNLEPLILKLSGRAPEKLDYLGVSFGLTKQLLKFWKRAGYVPVYIRPTTVDLTGEHSCIMVNVLNYYENTSSDWLPAYWREFRTRFVNSLSFHFSKFSLALALSVLSNETRKMPPDDVSRSELDIYFSDYDIRRLEVYSNNLFDYSLIMDLLPTLSKLYFLHQLDEVHLCDVQSAILLGVGLQHKDVVTVAAELDLPSSQVRGLFNRMITQYLKKMGC